MKLEIEHTPLAKNRPRFTFQGKKPRAYDPQVSLMNKIKWAFAKQMRDKGYLKLSEGPITVNLTAYMPIPSSWSKKRSIEVLGQPHTKKPDVDNISKIYLDILNGTAYADDAQICQLLCKKIYSDKPRVTIEIKPYT